MRTVIALTSGHRYFIAERQSGRVDKAVNADRRLKSTIEGSVNVDGNYELAGELLLSFERVMKKTMQGLYYGLYHRILSPDQLELLVISDQRFLTPDQLVDQIRPTQFRDITDDPLPDLTPNSWPLREPVYFVKLQPTSGGEPQQRILRLIRETPVDWEDFGVDVFRYGFVKSESGKAVCIMDLWKTLVVAIAAPWPDGRGRLRRGRKNPRSRDRRPR